MDVREIASRLGVRYVLEGSHRQLGQRVRITAQLIDATSGNHIWADRYERDLADIFAIQDDIADSVVGAIEPELLKTESRLSAARDKTQSSFVLSAEDEPSLRALEHQLKRDAGRCSRIRDFQLFVGDRRDDPTLIR